MRKRISFFCEILILCLLVFACVLPGSAGAEQDFVVSGKDYVLPEDSNFDYSKATSTEKFFYGATSLGTLHLKGAIEKDTKYNGRAAYGAKGDLSIQYAYNGAYQMKKEEYWHVEGDGTRWIRDYDLGFLNNIAKGCIMIEKSPNASSITCLNRMGYGYTVPVTIVGSANVPAEAMITPEITERPTITQKPESVEIADGAKSESSDEAKEQTHGSESMDAEKEPVATPEVKTNESEGKKTSENSLTIIVITCL